MTESKSKVEEVAGAACEYLSTVEGVEVAYDGNGSSVYLLCDDGQDAKPVKLCIDLEQFARAALKAMQEPSEAMVQRVADSFAEVILAEQTVRVLYAEMLDAALNEGGE